MDFAGYAIPTIIGEIKRHFRDRTWSVRVPRRLQEMRLAISEANATLSQDLGRSPTVADIAVHLNVTEEEVLEGLEAPGRTPRPRSPRRSPRKAAWSWATRSAPRTTSTS